MTFEPTTAGRSRPGARTRLVDAEFEDFYRHSFPTARRLAHLLLNGSADAEDVVQEVFTRIHGRFEGLRSPDAYLRVSVVNGCRQHHRAASRHDRWVRISTAGDEHVTVLVDPLLDAVAALSFRQRTAIVLRDWCDLPDEVIASTLGARPSTVQSLIRRGLHQLHGSLTT